MVIGTNCTDSCKSNFPTFTKARLFLGDNYLSYVINTELLTKLRRGTLKLNLESVCYDNVPHPITEGDNEHQ